MRILDNLVVQSHCKRWLQRIYHLSHILYPSRSILPEFPKIKVATTAYLVHCFPRQCLFNPDGENDQRLIAAARPMIDCLETICAAVLQPDYKGFNTIDPHVVERVVESILSFVEHFETWQKIDVQHLTVHIYSTLHLLEMHLGNLDIDMPGYENMACDLNGRISKLKSKLSFLDGNRWEANYAEYRRSPHPTSLADTRKIKPQIIMFYTNLQLVYEMILDPIFAFETQTTFKFFDLQDFRAVYTDEIEFFRKKGKEELDSNLQLQCQSYDVFFPRIAIMMKEMHALLTQRTSNPRDLVEMTNELLNPERIDSILLQNPVQWNAYNDFCAQVYSFLISMLCKMPKPTNLAKRQLQESCTALLANRIVNFLYQMWIDKLEYRAQLVHDSFYLLRILYKTISLGFANENFRRIQHIVVRGASQYCREAYEKKIAQDRENGLFTNNLNRHLRTIKLKSAEKYNGTFESISVDFYVEIIVSDLPWTRLTMIETLAPLGPRLETLRRQVHMVTVFCSLSTLLNHDEFSSEDRICLFDTTAAHFKKLSTIKSLCEHLELKFTQRGRWYLVSDSITAIQIVYDDTADSNPLHVTWYLFFVFVTFHQMIMMSCRLSLIKSYLKAYMSFNDTTVSVFSQFFPTEVQELLVSVCFYFCHVFGRFLTLFYRLHLRCVHYLTSIPSTSV